jgi:hypothetical protein
MALGKKIDSPFIIYFCTECKKQLAVEDETTGTGWVYDSCEHYDWALISITCYYYYKQYPKRCNAEFIQEMKRKSVLKIENDGHVFLLIPNTGGVRND